MAVLPFRPTPFFANKNQAFWRLQAAGWGGALVLRAMSSIANGQPASFLVLVLIATVTGFSLSLILSVIYRILITQRALITWGVTALVLPVAVTLYAFIDAWVIGLYRPDSAASFAQLLIGVFYLDMTLLAAWSALYYAINFYLQIEEQNDQLIRLENQATQAQLAMLRYQLNPHFLFNTLNAISTLILDGRRDTANGMVGSLSAFLRYSLDSDPVQRVSLAQEIDATNLYLGIEQLRFAERLRVRTAITPEARNALVPSLILQPLIENAVKYAVSKREEGGTIEIEARRIGDDLVLVLRDDGPGCTNLDERPSGHGVGLRNTQERLRVLYGDNQMFSIATREPRGCEVRMQLPFESIPMENVAPAELAA